MKNFEQTTETLENSDLKHLYLFFYLIPIVGFFPSLWTLYRYGREVGGAGGAGEEITIQNPSWKVWRREVAGGSIPPANFGDPNRLCRHASSRGAGNPRTRQAQLSAKSKIQNSLTPHTSPLTPHTSPLTPHPSLTVSRLSVTLAFAWLLSYLLLNIGAETSEFLTLRLLVLNSFLTSGYFLVSIWLMVRLASGKSVRLPGFTALAERVIGKHLS
jgi:hypothetical protein